MTSLPGNRQYEAVGEPQCWSPAEVLNRCGDGIGVLQGQMLVVEQHIDRSREFGRATFVDRRQHPRGFGEHEMRHPRVAFAKLLSRRDLPGVVPRHQTNQNVRVKRKIGCSLNGFRPSQAEYFSANSFKRLR